MWLTTVSVTRYRFVDHRKSCQRARPARRAFVRSGAGMERLVERLMRFLSEPLGWRRALLVVQDEAGTVAWESASGAA